MQLIKNLIRSFFSFFEFWLSYRQYIILCSIFVGIFAGAAAALLKICVHLIRKLAEIMYSIEWLGLIPPMMPLLGILLCVWYVIKFRNKKLGKGLGNVLYFIKAHKSKLPADMTYSHIITSGLTIGFGGSAGLEAPIVVTGAALGSNFSQLTRQKYKDRNLMLACGASAGISAAFNAPVAGMIFSVELLLNKTSIATFLPLIISSVTGTIFAQILSNKEILFSFCLMHPFDYQNTMVYVFFGYVCGLIAFYYSQSTLMIENFFNKLGDKYTYRKALLGGLLLGFLIWLFPVFYGEGYDSIKFLVQNQPEKLLANSIFSKLNINSLTTLVFVAAIGLLKVFATALTLNSGGNGGNFAPALFVGAYVGFVFSTALNFFFKFNLPIENFVLVGMCGLISGLFHAPLMSIFLIAELTGGYNLMIPLMIVSAISLLVKRHYMPLSLEQHKLANKNCLSLNQEKTL
jgi:CIC family chloride channel protein